MNNPNDTHQPSPIVFVCLLGLLGYFGLNVIQTMTDGYIYQDRLTALEQQVQDLSNKKDTLNNQLQEVQSNQFIESEARNKLHLAKSNETVVIFPQSSEARVTTVQTPQSITNSPIPSPGYTEEWYKLFFK